MAIGTSRGGGQIKPFIIIPSESQHYTVTGLNLNGLRKV